MGGYWRLIRFFEQLRIGDGDDAFPEGLAVGRQGHLAEAADLGAVPGVAGQGEEVVPVDLDLHGGGGAPGQEGRGPGVGGFKVAVQDIVRGVDVRGFDDDAPVLLGGGVVILFDPGIDGRNGDVLGDDPRDVRRILIGNIVRVQFLGRDGLLRFGGNGEEEAGAQIRVVIGDRRGTDVPREPELGNDRIVHMDVIEHPGKTGHVVGEPVIPPFLVQPLQQGAEAVVVDVPLDGGGILAHPQHPGLHPVDQLGLLGQQLG